MAEWQLKFLNTEFAQIDSYNIRRMRIPKTWACIIATDAKAKYLIYLATIMDIIILYWLTREERCFVVE